MKYIGNILIFFFVLTFILVAFTEGEWAPLVALILSYACYKSVFCINTESKLYDPIDFVEE